MGEVFHNEVQKNSGFQWSGNCSQPPSAIGNKDLNTQDLISEQNMEIRKSSFKHNQNKHLTVRRMKLKYTLRLKHQTPENRHLLRKGNHLSIPGKLLTRVKQNSLDTITLNADWLKNSRIMNINEMGL